MLHATCQGTGPRLVLVHGFTQVGWSWGPVATDLASDHDVVLVDLPGHGGSGTVRADLVESAVLVGDAGGRATYVGYSLGGRVALHLAILRPWLVERLVLVGATAGIDDHDERVARRRADEALAAELERDGVEAFLGRWLAQPLFAGLATERAGLEGRLANTPEGLAASLRRCGTGTQTPLWDRLGQITCPVLVVAGAEDAKFRALGARLAAAIPDAALEVVPHAGHAAHLEQPDAFTRLVRAWLTVTET